jgi:secondary thiamine-phosphate synthase enzyme
MAVRTERIRASTRGHADVVDITGEVEQVIAGSGLANGSATLFVVGSTATLSTIEYEGGAVKDLQLVLERLAPSDGHYFHHERWGDDNGHSHVRACLMGPSLVVPFVDAKPTLGTWQQIVLVDFDTRSRKREIVVQLMGE